MAGHSKWANIKHRKAAVDKKRGKIWSKISRALMAAAKNGGDPATNLTLRYAVDEAKAANMPKDTIQRAIDKGSGAAGGADFEDVTYEGYGPSGAAVLVEALTDNRNRTSGDVKTIFNKTGNSLGNPGSVAYMFQTKGQIFIDASKADEDQLMEIALEAGADDVQAPEEEGGAFTILTDPTQFLTVKEALEAANIELADAEITKIPDTTAELSVADAQKLLKLIDTLEDNDDVQKVYHNAEIPDEAYAEA
ncbi:MAG: YebC/PmpR family DNA-binding transcriptional regulator [Planctomycetota bacterium]